jgi:hypothetical protein
MGPTGGWKDPEKTTNQAGAQEQLRWVWIRLPPLCPLYDDASPTSSLLPAPIRNSEISLESVLLLLLIINNLPQNLLSKQVQNPHQT